MEPDERTLEENTARLLQAAVGEHVRPSAGRRRQMLQMMLDEVGAAPQSAVREFPDSIVALLAGVLLAALGYLILQDNPTGYSMSPLEISACVLAGINLALVPVASAIIVIRRHYVKTA